MELTYFQKKDLFENGYVKVAGVVPPIMVESALRAINHSVGEGLDREEIVTMRAQTYCRELVNTPVITGLFHKTPTRELAESLIGSGALKDVTSGQIALRFPSTVNRPSPPQPHLDGMHTPTNGVPKGVIANFTMLVGVFLSDVRQEFAGNFTVWPGTHHIYQKYFREHGPDTLLNGMPQVGLPKSQQLTANAGDVVFCHYQLAHGVALNVSPHTRYAIFFRLKHVDHDKDWREPMTDIWSHWPGIRNLHE